VGYRTALHDNPSLTTRLWKGPNPLRIIVDPKGELLPDLKVFTDGAPTWHLIYGHEIGEEPSKVGYQKVLVNADVPIAQSISNLCQVAGIQSLLVEGGAGLLSHFLEEDVWDEALIFSAPKVFFRSGIAAPPLPIRGILEETSLGPDRLLRLANAHSGFWHTLLQKSGAEALTVFGQVPGAF